MRKILQAIFAALDAWEADESLHDEFNNVKHYVKVKILDAICTGGDA